MKIKANISFCGTLNMARGEIRDIPENGMLTDLLNAGYVEAVAETEAPAAEASEVKPNANKRGKSKSD